jgi:hypothetical protein
MAGKAGLTIARRERRTFTTANLGATNAPEALRDHHIHATRRRVVHQDQFA